MSYMKRNLEETIANSQYLDLIREDMDPATIVKYADCFVDGGWPEFFKRQDEVNREFILKTFPLIDWDEYKDEDFPYDVVVTGDHVEVTFILDDLY